MPTKPAKRKRPPTINLPKSDRLSEPARKLLSRALTMMVRYPDTVNMGDWLYHDDDVKPSRRRPAPYCGTVGCIAGHVCVAKERKVIEGGLRFGRERLWPDERAPMYLGLSLAEANKLFLPSNWPEPWCVDDRTWNKIKPRTIVARVRHWIKTGE